MQLFRSIRSLRVLLPHERSTYLRDLIRLPIDGLNEIFVMNLYLMLAISYFEVHPLGKAAISGSRSLGMLLVLSITPISIRYASQSGKLAAIFTLISSFSLILAALNDDKTLYTIFIVIQVMALIIRIPVINTIYEGNYHPRRRGRLLSHGYLIMMSTNIVVGLAIGPLLDNDIENYRFIFIVYGILLLLSSLLLFTTPSIKHRQSDMPINPFKALSLIWRNRFFSHICIGWFLCGFANLWILPIRFEYLVNPENGLNFTPRQVLMTMVIIPGFVRFFSIYLSGRIFDRLHLIVFRIVTIIFFLAGTMLFFLTDNIIIITVAACFYAIGTGGALLIWNLAMMRIAPPGESQSYMICHTFLTGLRGFIGPYISYAFLTRFSFSYLNLALISCALLILSILVFLPLISHPRL